ncbi:MAG: asparagine synthase-related protein [Pseudomonadota bacterium]
MPVGLVAPNTAAGEFIARSALLQSRARDLRWHVDSERQCAVGAGRVFVDDGFVCALDGEPRAAGSAIGIERLVELIRKDPIAATSRLEGEFSLAFIDRATSEVLVAIDKMGIGRATYATSESLLAFSSNALDVRSVVDAKVSNQAIHDFLFFHMVPSPQTVFDGISKLPLAHLLQWSPGQGAQAQPYWQPKYADGPGAQHDLAAALNDALGRAVRSAATPDCGAFLSGGLDSSTVAGYLAKVSDTPARTFSIGFGVPEYDELKYARIAASHFGCDATELNVTSSDIVESFEHIARQFDEPFGNSSVIPTYCCAKLAKEHGITTMLAGDGGDELFGGNERYAKQRIFERYFLLPRAVRRGLIEPFANRFHPELSPLPFRKLKSYVDQAQIRLPHRLVSWNFAFREGVDSLLDDDFAASVNKRSPHEHMQEVYDAFPSDEYLDRFLVYDWRITLADNDLRKVGQMCDLAGVKVRYPMLDDAVVAMSTDVPPMLRMQGNKLRYFFKEAMRGFLPEAILTKPKHGFGLPFGVWLKDDASLRELVFSYLLDLKKRGMFKASFIDNLVDRHAGGHASYFGYFIWDLAMLECWLSLHIDAQTGRSE